MVPMMMEVLESAVVIKGLPGCNEVVPPVAAVEVLASNNGGGGMELVVFIQFIAWFAEVMEPVLALADSTGGSDIAQQLCWSTGTCGSNGGFGPMMLMEVLEPVVLVMEVLPPNDSGVRLGLLTGTAIN